MDFINKREIYWGSTDQPSSKGLTKPNTLEEANLLKIRYKFQVLFFTGTKKGLKAQGKLDIVKEWIKELKNPSESESTQLSQRNIEVQKPTVVQEVINEPIETVVSEKDTLVAKKSELVENLSNITAEIEELTDKKLAYQKVLKKFTILTKVKDELFGENKIGSFGTEIDELEAIAATLEGKLESLEGELSSELLEVNNTVQKELSAVKLKITHLKINTFLKLFLKIITFGIFAYVRNKEKAALQMDLQRIVRVLNGSEWEIEEKLKVISEVFKTHSDGIANNLTAVDVNLESLHQEADYTRQQIKEIEGRISQIDGLPIQEEEVVVVQEEIVQEVVEPKVMGRVSILKSTKEKLEKYLSTINKSGALALVSNKKSLATEAEGLAKEMDFFTYMDQVTSHPNTKTSFIEISKQGPKAKVMLTQLQKTVQRESGTYTKEYNRNQIKTPEERSALIEYFAKEHNLDPNRLDRLLVDVANADEKTRVASTKELVSYMIGAT